MKHFSQLHCQDEARVKALSRACQATSFFHKTDMSVDRLLDAAYYGNITKAMNELNHGVSINAANKRGMAALHYTARQGHAEATQKLLERGARTSAADAEKRTPLHLACKEGRIGTAAVLIGSGACIDAVASHKKSAVYYACWSGEVEVCRLLRGATDLKIAANVQALIESVLDWDVEAPKGKYTAMLQYLLRVQDRFTRPPPPPPPPVLAKTATAAAAAATALATAAAAAAAATKPARVPAATAAATEHQKLARKQPTAAAAAAAAASAAAAAASPQIAASSEKATSKTASSCCICFDANSATIITCSSGEHSLCADCLNSFVTAEADSGKHHIAAHAGKLRCPGADCTSVYEHYDLAQHLPR
jgi:Ankyrin repeats (3 copies)